VRAGLPVAEKSYSNKYSDAETNYGSIRVKKKVHYSSSYMH
jgi:hypothetical protein